ncbi:MAG TPA: anhydro-N-acetylmuramic acid kinase [Actinomycetota bacterium]
MRVIGLLSGTSHDAIEAAAAELELSGEDLVLRPLGSATTAFEPELRRAIAKALPPGRPGAGELCTLDARLGQAFAEVAAQADRVLCGGGAQLIVSHGQTVFHWVEDGRVLGTLQLGEPAWIAERTGLPVVSNLRSRDVAAGGQGAPLVSFVDCLLLPPGPVPRAALNLGGIANLTVVLPAPSGRPPFAFDAGPANALIDAAVSLVTGGDEAFDAGGRRGARGRVDRALLDRLLADPYYEQPAPKSTGKERFNATHLSHAVGRPPSVWGDDLVATATVHAAEVVARECRRHRIAELFVSGGGTRNPTLMGALADRTPGVVIRPSDALGIPEEAKEAYAFAILGFLTFQGVAATIPSCTGAAHASILGSITPGARPLRMPSLARTAPRRIRIVPGETDKAGGTGADAADGAGAARRQGGGTGGTKVAGTDKTGDTGATGAA